jgi:hypothetical protein
MSDVNKMKAVGKIAVGAFRVTSGVLTATGHGLLGTYLRNHKMTHAAMHLGKLSVKGGVQQFQEGMRELGG